MTPWTAESAPAAPAIGSVAWVPVGPRAAQWQTFGESLTLGPDRIAQKQLAFVLLERAELQGDGCEGAAVENREGMLAASEAGRQGEEEIVHETGLEERDVEGGAAFADDAADATGVEVSDDGTHVCD